MKIEDLKVGVKVTSENKKEYIVIDIKKEKNKDYLVCIPNSKPILPIVFEYKFEDNEIKIKKEIDKEILKIIYSKMVKENM